MVVSQELSDDLLSLWVLRHQFRYTRPLLFRKVKLHMTRHLLKLLQQLFIWGSNNVVDFVNLVKLVRAWKKRS